MFVTAFFCFTAYISSACTNSWWHLMIARIFLGVGIGPKSATLSIYAAECALAKIREALQCVGKSGLCDFFSTRNNHYLTINSFGIMLGTACNMAFYYVPDRSGVGWIELAAYVWNRRTACASCSSNRIH
ncbi:uncharacterized protein Z519_11110 [Cladophialophora bantiana CBS 173.52]|uniref:Major facilitator superfamily (MFS) profile domain-containing protein n=1 Tax=Cladophialophora bantiana (strain ATCC 10958 / CBS 173.52 / CDC B-1940 / NIH 8579) TaxID=1442370 RepID=A0A0D2HAU1_CLAB1|nr:uncharacterized protein Z519_11110 [Cladophialophora bantiana CBS 173.52]KIW88000.1 hypothetical protein Z519_11110 [Cladophialophora bantiana CBS 173.52]